jgi:DNA-binding CsgD family transcriptional regulator
MNLLDSLEMMSPILEAKTSEDLHKGLENAAKKCGFDTFVSGVQMVGSDGTLQHNLISAYPDAWQREYAERGYVWTDPTVIHCQTSIEPLVWDSSFFEQHQGVELWEGARAFGLSHGVSVAMHEASGTKSMLSLARDQSITETEKNGEDIVAAVRIIASCAHFASLRIAEKVLNQPGKVVHLTRQETECLKWVSAGKTSKEISKLMLIAEATVAFHLKNAMQKLGANNRPQALAIAIRLGFIH